MKLTFLGTSAGRPTKARNVTSIALSLPEPQHCFWLFDTGEGTQHRLLGSKLKLNKLERIFITHLHGDHLYGLPGLLTSRSYFEGAVPLQIYGPPGLQAFIDCVFHQSGVHLGYELSITEIVSGQIVTDDFFTVEAAELEHRMQCFGYRVTEHSQPGKLNLPLLKTLGVPSGPMYGKLKQGEDVTLPSGEMIRSSDVVGPPVAGRIITILGDTRPCENAITLSKDADLIVHEGTFAGGMEEKAAAYGHSTVLQAAETAAKANVKQLVMTHFSSRFDDAAIELLVQDAKEIFANVSAAHDYLEINVDRVTSETD
ncbi:ribonuclease Z [Paenibacillus baekrokdamisoli]|uniref:Ribonuclease Z n=1 Tax=Paenibacillus baekrokdamisoli TaxID=1712516 RepID=A0A3G9IM29_9BACL|nr:ribonuclease Z [Paenibacillus baekrokdamisoli]MBB3070540.1 ribonuclease Z [Paenibacillus baekrokdamisoli]BBH19890.1 ribonuclease Z [Paenibacillus baekrokdamisoli]